MIPKALGGAKPAPPACLAHAPLVALITLALLAAGALWAPPPSSPSLSLRGSPSAALDAAYEAWLATYRAPNPEHQAFCKGALHNSTGAGEYLQDLYLFHNVFKHWPAAGRRGVYVDSGTSDPERDSNTLFYDRCLGWKGICVEPQKQYWQAIEANRSCTLVKGCLAAVKGTAAVVGSGPMAQVQRTPDGTGGSDDSGGSDGGEVVQCHRLEDVLTEAGIDPLHVDFWSLDVEGAEMGILHFHDFTRVSVGALLIEDFWLSQRDLDRRMTTRGFIKVQQMAADSVWVPRGAPLVEPPWVPYLGDAYWIKLKGWRTKLIAEGKIKPE